MREIRSVCNRASVFHVHLLKCQFEHNGTVHSNTETEQNIGTQRHRTEQRHRDTEHGVEGRVLEGLLSPVPCVGECNEVRYKGLGAAARMRSGREQ